MNDYERVARSIRFLAANHEAQPDLSTLARAAGLSPHHFHRLFRRWAGVTPKDLLQILTLERARRELALGTTVLDAAFDVGLSSPGRLHDLCITLESATPGEIKSGGSGWTITAGFAPSPFGTCCIAEGPHGICDLHFCGSKSRAASSAGILSRWPKAAIRWSDRRALSLASSIFTLERRPAALAAHVRGTPFQVRVWRALLQVPPGGLVSYSRLAATTGAPHAARAVGNAIG